MTTTYHTDISVGAAANASVFNAPLGQLDAHLDDAMSFGVNNNAELVAARGGYANLDARLDALTLGSGIVSTQANGAASAGQKVLTVDSTTGVLPGGYIGYLLNGATVEYNQIDTIDSPTQMTLTTNIGTGGILDNEYIQVVSIADYYGYGTFDSLFIGAGTPSGYGLVTLGDTIGGAVNNEGFRDESVVTAVGSGQYASFDATPEIAGAVAYDHYHAFQARPTYGSSSAVGRLASFWSEPILNGNVTNLYHLHVKDPTGAGTVTVQAGIRIEELTQGTTNYGIYQLGASMLSYFQGAIQSSGRVYTSGSMDAATLGVGTQNTGVGLMEISGGGTATRQYGIVQTFAYTGLLDAYGHYSSVTVENGETSGSNSIYGTRSLAAMTAAADDCYAAALYGGYYGSSWNASSGKSITALISNTLEVAAPLIFGVGTIVIGAASGLNIANQGNAKTITSYGVQIASQSGSGTNYALATNAGLVVINAGGDAASDTTIKSDSYDALVVDSSENAIAVMNHASGKVGFYGTAPIAKQTGVAVSAGGIHAALVALGLIAA